MEFFKKKGHAVVPSSSLVPQNDPSVLFTTAGMQQFKPYYTAPENALRDFGTKNIVTVQKCVRTGDIDEVGDSTHLTFFEMLGNFSFGGYWKKEAIEYAHEFITKELGLAIDYVSIFKDEKSGIPADEESRTIWAHIDQKLLIKEHNRKDNFWGPTGNEGPCGPTTEIYVNGVEIWNIVFNEYYKTREGKYEPLPIKGIDTGMGLERLLTMVQRKENVYETDLFQPIIEEIEKKYADPVLDDKAKRIIADHTRSAVFMANDGVTPSNTDRGYILRRLLRRAIFKINKSVQGFSNLYPLVDTVIKNYENRYPELKLKSKDTHNVFEEEEAKFSKTIAQGKRELEKLAVNGIISGTDAFILFSTYGFPLELTKEFAQVEEADFWKEMEKHQELSRTSSAGMFKGGLANHEEKTINHHTAHHLLLAALQDVLGENVKQRGSNITEERLRMDFSFERKMTDEEKKKVEEIVNDRISQNLPVVRKEMPREEAEKIGAEMEFGAKYPDTVSVYFIEDKEGEPISKEFCGGPHVGNTGSLGKFRILKEEAVSAGVRRIKAVLE